jgi:hypothetical protein
MALRENHLTKGKTEHILGLPTGHPSRWPVLLSNYGKSMHAGQESRRACFFRRVNNK